jgi:hypothetical protein
MRTWAWPSKAAAVALLVCAGACADTGARAAPQPGDKSAGPGASTEGRSCFRNADVASWADVDRTTINLRVNVRDYYQIKLLAPCGDIDFSQRIGLKSGAGSDFICTGLDVEVIAPTSIGPQTCPAISLRKLTAAEVAALPGRQKP